MESKSPLGLYKKKEYRLQMKSRKMVKNKTNFNFLIDNGYYDMLKSFILCFRHKIKTKDR